jgi:hypothetical protein
LEHTSDNVRAGRLSAYDGIELKLVNKSLQGADIRIPGGIYKNVRSAPANLQPLLFVCTEFVGEELPSSRMLIVVAMNFGMTFETYRDGIVYCIWTAFCSRYYVIRFNLHAAKSMADTASPMTRFQ